MQTEMLKEISQNFLSLLLWAVSKPYSSSNKMINTKQLYVNCKQDKTLL